MDSEQSRELEQRNPYLYYHWLASNKLVSNLSEQLLDLDINVEIDPEGFALYTKKAAAELRKQIDFIKFVGIFKLRFTGVNIKNINKLVSILNANFTNPDVANRFIKHFNNLELIKDLIHAAGLEPGEYTLIELAQKLQLDVVLLLNWANTFDPNTRINPYVLINKPLPIDIDFVFKRYPEGKVYVGCAAGEIDQYGKYYEFGVNTFAAYNKVIYDSVKGQDYIVTLRYEQFTVLEEVDLLMQTSNGILAEFFTQLAKLHKNGLFHNDLHFKNVGIMDKDEEINVVFFMDLERSWADFSLLSKSFAIGLDLTNVCSGLLTAIDLNIYSMTNQDATAALGYVEVYLKDVATAQKLNDADIEKLRIVLEPLIKKLDEIAAKL